MQGDCQWLLRPKSVIRITVSLRPVTLSPVTYPAITICASWLNSLGNEQEIINQQKAGETCCNVNKYRRKIISQTLLVSLLILFLSMESLSLWYKEATWSKPNSILLHPTDLNIVINSVLGFLSFRYVWYATA